MYDEWNGIAGMLGVRRVLEVAVVTGDEHGHLAGIEGPDEGLEKRSEVFEQGGGKHVDTVVANLVRQKVLKKGERVILYSTGQNLGRLCWEALSHI
jgi:hypothetical protein